MKSWSDILQASDALIIEWASAQPWARDMAACQQDSQWHAEGDVWTHTKMVCTELERLAEWSSLERMTQIKLLFAGLFHDSGKPATTAFDAESGRTRSPRHALVGAEIARRFLRELKCDLATREQIASLVRFHGRPPYLLEKSNPEHEVISLSWLVNNRLLYLLALADTRGRHAKEMTRPEENLHLWKMLAKEHKCFDRAYAFANDHARFLFYRDQLSSLHYAPHEEYRCTVTLMSGLPGAGKDLGSLDTGAGCRSSRWTRFAKIWTSKPPVIRAKLFKKRVRNAGNTSGHAEILPSTPQTSRARCANVGLNYLQTTLRELKLFTLSHPRRRFLSRINVDRGLFLKR